MINKHRAEQGASAICFGISMHIGNLMYGNIGTLGRLVFTVIGSAVNDASRIESTGTLYTDPRPTSRCQR